MKLKKEDRKKLYKVRHISAFLSSKIASDNIARTEMRKAPKNRGVPKKLQKTIENALMALVGQTECLYCPHPPDFSSLLFPFAISLQKTLHGHFYTANLNLVLCVTSSHRHLFEMTHLLTVWLVTLIML